MTPPRDERGRFVRQGERRTTSAERNRAYRARHRDDPAYRAGERARVAAWRKRVGWRRAQWGPEWAARSPA